MTLRKQLIIVSLCLLALPWAGCQYVKEMESVLRQNQQQLLQSAVKPITHIVKNTLIEQLTTITAETDLTPKTLYSPYRNSPIAIDGYDDEWKRYSHHALAFSDSKIANKNTNSYFQVSSNKKNLLLFFHIEDSNIVYHRPGSPSPTHNDHLKITLGDKKQQTIVLYTSGQGSIQALTSNHFKNRDLRNRDLKKNKGTWKALPPSQRIQGYWQEMSSDNSIGYNIELSIPLSLIKGSIEFSIYDANNIKNIVTKPTLTSGTLSLLQPIFSLTEKLSAFQQPSWDIAIINSNGWLLSPQIQNKNINEKNNNTLKNTIKKPSPSLWESALSRFYRYIMEGVVEGKNPSNALPIWPFDSAQLSQSKQNIPPETLTRYQNQWYRVAHSQRSILSVINPIYHNDTQDIIGYVILTQSSKALLSLTNNALLRIINLSLTTAALSALVLLGFASILSYRIRNLRNQAEKAVSHDGKVQPFSASKSKDEIGDLSRSYAALLQRIQDYNHYLETLSGKLAHELRTPLTISKSSIEMLKMVDHNDTEKHQRYLHRAEEGLERLRLILNAMSEASRVEQVIQHSDIHQVNIKNLMNEMCLAYQDTYPDFTFTFHFQSNITSLSPSPEITLHCAPELIAQMLDKLIDNATGFAPKHSEILLSLTATEKSVLLTVDNTGPLLPDNMQQQLFDSMVSIRKEKTDTPHLGLGLYIVKLIAQHHHGQLSACNNAENSGVSFCVELPTR